MGLVDPDEGRPINWGDAIQWPVISFALIVALVSAVVIVIFTLVEVHEPGTPLAVAFGTFPVLVFLVATLGVRWVGVAVLSIVLGAYTWLWVEGTFVYDTSSTGGLIFIFLPFYGVVALMLARMAIWVGHLVTRRKAAPDPDGRRSSEMSASSAPLPSEERSP